MRGKVTGIPQSMDFETILYGVDGPVATITLNRPERLNTIVPPMPDEVSAAVALATLDDAVKVVVLRGAGRAFCAATTSAAASGSGAGRSRPAGAGTPARTS
jgi:enoyl-CoA hydratase/carnithine racemase